MRRRLNLSVPQDLYEELRAIEEDYNFGSMCEMVLALLRLFALKVRSPGALEEADPTISEEIEDMFADLSEYEPTPSTTVVPRRHRTTR